MEADHSCLIVNPSFDPAHGVLVTIMGLAVMISSHSVNLQKSSKKALSLSTISSSFAAHRQAVFSSWPALMTLNWLIRSHQPPPADAGTDERNELAIERYSGAPQTPLSLTNERKSSPQDLINRV